MKIRKGRERINNMSKGIAKFKKVSESQFVSDYLNIFKGGNINYLRYNIYENITLPTRSTFDSAGYDFKSPIDFVLKPGDTIKLPTGIRCKIDPKYVLMLYIRSSIGFKYQTVLANGTGIIDGDYYNADNEGHIMIKLRNDGDENCVVRAGDRIVQGIFLPYGITVDDNVENKRIGGIGSTGK